ncbi:helix-turn-helix domain-containing protein [Maribacter aestuarii]|uniref:helix-turn-helix domain-containing protein n=1 Tax=Maribacter aestuarii TaxID=1130723 RepID=UPI0025A4FA56|nr:helix-turn-helix domain-containing protein [Maribacter aestuarii]
MSNPDILGILGFIIFLLFILLALFLLTVKTKNKMSNKLLASFLIVTAIDISAFFYYRYIELPPVLEMLRIQLSNFKDPILFLYFLSIIYADFKLQRKHLVHLAPWAISIIVLIPNFFMVDRTSQSLFLDAYWQTSEQKWLSIFGTTLEVVYIVAELYYLFRYRKLLLENFTGKAYFYNYRWIKQLMIFILIAQLLTFIKGIVVKSDASEKNADLAFIILLCYGLFFSFWLVWKALHSPKLFRGITVDLKLSKELINERKSKEDLSKETKQQIEVLKDFMVKKEPYLDPSLTVQKLSEQSGIPSKQLSVLINQHLGQHFFDFVNGYRIDCATKILSDPTKKDLTILEILYEIGFNSKSSFNTAFKKHTGTTPTAYRKNNLVSDL